MMLTKNFQISIELPDDNPKLPHTVRFTVSDGNALVMRTDVKINSRATPLQEIIKYMRNYCKAVDEKGNVS